MHRVLVADDELNIRNILDFTLNAEGFDVITAENGSQAVDLALEHAPDLIILDVMMPGLNGTEACAKLKQDPRTAGIPVILLTARSSRLDREAGAAAGADYYLTKPFSPHTLVEKVSAVLGARR